MLSLPPTLTQSQAQLCLDRLTQDMQQEADAQVVVNAAALSSFDSSALAVLLAVRRECARLGKRFSVQGLPDRLRDLAVLYGIDGLLTAA